MSCEELQFQLSYLLHRQLRTNATPVYSVCLPFIDSTMLKGMKSSSGLFTRINIINKVYKSD